ncbi:MAG: hypothetical protein JRD71_08365 [Deltaproteobacteria bacterium]|nr:hypothetical protein [Deltaproteobacteria bacterium]
MKWKNVVCDMINNVISTPLFTDRKHFLLSSISGKDRINEMEFYFPLKTVTPKKIRKIFSDYGGINIPEEFPSNMERLSFSPSKGFMKGYIDMIFRYNDKFYLVDWKSNHLGNNTGDYKKASIDRVMSEDLYILQYHIYLLALNQYLRLHLPEYSYESDFGGVLYLFIRGIDKHQGPEFGIYRDIPNTDLIYALGRELIPGFIE